MQSSPETVPPKRSRRQESPLTPKQLARVALVPESRKKLLARALSGGASPRSAIKAFCQSCVGYEELPSSVTDCKAEACPLFAYRPYRK